MTLNADQLEKEILLRGGAMLAQIAASSRHSMFSTDFYTEKFLGWGMQDETLKINLFRFVDVLASLSDAPSVIRHVHEYFAPIRDKIPEFLQKGLELSPDSLTSKIAAPAIKKQVKFVAERFIVGETPQQALKPLRKLRKLGQSFTVDLLGEATVSEVESIAYLDRYLELLDVLSREVPEWPESAPLIKEHIGECTPVNISVKLSALYSQTRPLNAKESVRILGDRLALIFSKAKSVGAFVYVDMEDSSLTTITLDTFRSVLEREEFRQYDRLGIVLQAYLRRTAGDLQDLLSWVQTRGTPIGVRLVKGAYWDTETVLALQQGWEIPVWQNKSCSDANYEELSLFLLKNRELLRPAFGSHNVRSLMHAIVAAEEMGVATTEFELQVLYGMGAGIARAFAAEGFLVRNYAPVGELIPGMGYLVRRLLENTSNEGFLRLSMHEQKDPVSLLQKPHFIANDSGKEHLRIDRQSQFKNAPLQDFSLESVRSSLSAAIRARLAVSPAPLVSPVVEGKRLETKKQFPSFSPEDRRMQLAEVRAADARQAELAVESLARAFPSWRARPVAERSELLRKTATIVEKRRDEIAAIIILESGKAWAEADADIAEAIDFLRYYALEAEKLFRIQKLGQLPGEENSYFYEPRGVTTVISPWNFPFAIPCGMFSAALVSGNCAALKPAEQTSLTASVLFDCFLQAGLPPDVAAFLPGIGEEIGPILVEHSAVATVVFTGSRDVGLLLLRQGAQSSSGAVHVKRIVAEMGGKNAIIVDDDADFDEAVKGIVSSAFGYQGQKCSACSRAIIVGQNYERVLSRLVEATKSITLGPSSEPGSFLGPVIDEEAYRRINRIITESKRDCRLLVQGAACSNKHGYFIPPTIFADIPEGHALLSREIFGPVLAVQKASSFEEALSLANNSEYGLTGAVFSRSPRNIELAAREFRVGNLYINRGCTGALVMRQPFGGAKMSGVGSKAGGPDYLLQFVIPRALTENTLRRGFAPTAGE